MPNPTFDGVRPGTSLTSARRLLEGVRVTEFCSTAAGPFSAMLLADMGAQVIKIEPVDGDALRQWPPLSNGYSENFASLNRGKHSVSLDLKDPVQRDIARRLALEGDVVIENNRPGVMDRLGLGAAELRASKPSLIFCSISAFGQTGPRATEGGYDLTIQAATGVMSVTGEEAGAPVKCGVPIADFTSGLYAAFSIAAALSAVRNGEPGCTIDVPMFGCTLAISALQTSEYFGTNRNPRKLGSAHPRNAPYQAFQAADGYFAIAAGNQQLWIKLLRLLGMEALKDDTRFIDTASRATNQLALKEILERHFSSHGVEHWLDILHDSGIPHSRINDFAQALEDPQVEHMQWVRSLHLPNGVTTRTFISPLRIDGQPMDDVQAPPKLGEHNHLYTKGCL